MAIKSVEEIKNKTERFVPKLYTGKTYRKVSAGDRITIVSCVFSVYPAKDKKTGETLTWSVNGGVKRPFLNCTIYFGLSDGTYTSLRNSVVQLQMTELTGFRFKEVGEFEYHLDVPETVTVVQTVDTYGKGDNKKDYVVLAFKQ